MLQRSSPNTFAMQRLSPEMTTPPGLEPMRVPSLDSEHVMHGSIGAAVDSKMGPGLLAVALAFAAAASMAGLAQHASESSKPVPMASTKGLECHRFGYAESRADTPRIRIAGVGTVAVQRYGDGPNPYYDDTLGKGVVASSDVHVSATTTRATLTSGRTVYAITATQGKKVTLTVDKCTPPANTTPKKRNGG